jgi:hypothetical protein
LLCVYTCVPVSLFCLFMKNQALARCRWLTSVILATEEAEIRKMAVQSQPGQIVHKTLSWRKPPQKRTNGVAQGEGPEFKSQYHKKKEALN